MLYIIIIILVLFIDQGTKYLVYTNLDYGEHIKMIEGFFYITYIENKGAAHGILQNMQWLFISITIIALIVMIYVLIKSKSRWLSVALSILMGGAIGNLLDRIFRGSVVDFMDFYFGSYDYAIFNLADSSVVIGTTLLAIYMLFIYKDKNKLEKVSINENNKD
jgi:signal peptidase II